MTPTDYEKAVLEWFLTHFPPPTYRVVHNTRLQGKRTRVKRQIDVCIFETGSPAPCLLIEAKRHGRAIDAGLAGMTIALIQDVGGIPAVMVSTAGFSVAAANHLEVEQIGHLTITLKEAMGLRWLPLLSERFGIDREFRHISGNLVEALRTGQAEPFIDVELPYEEWLAIFCFGLNLWPRTTARVLKALAREHHDDVVRFNVAVLLEEAGQLSAADLKAVVNQEADPDAREALLAML